VKTAIGIEFNPIWSEPQRDGALVDGAPVAYPAPATV